MATLAQCKTLLDQAATAVAASDYAAAERYALQAQIGLAGIPDQRDGEQEIRQRQGEVAALLASIRASKGATAGVQRTKLIPGRVSPT